MQYIHCYLVRYLIGCTKYRHLDRKENKSGLTRGVYTLTAGLTSPIKLWASLEGWEHIKHEGVLKRPASKLEAPDLEFASTLTRAITLEVVAERE